MARNPNSWWRTPVLHRFERLQQREDRCGLVTKPLQAAETEARCRGCKHAPLVLHRD